MAKKKVKKEPAPNPTGGGKFRVECPVHSDVVGNRWNKGSVIESDDDMTQKFPNAFSRVDDDEEPDDPDVKAEDLIAGGGKVKRAAEEGPEATGDEEDLTDATDAFDGAKDKGLTVLQKDDGSFVVRKANEEDVEFATADDVVAFIDGQAADEEPAPKKKVKKK